MGRVRYGLILDLIICLVCLFSMIIATDFVYTDIKGFCILIKLNISFDHDLIDCLFHSLFLIFILVSLYLGIYQSAYCCALSRDTICDHCGCNGFAAFWCACCARRAALYTARKRRVRKRKKATKEEMLLQDSTHTHTSNTCTIQDLERKFTNGTNSKLTDYHASVPRETATLTCTSLN